MENIKVEDMKNVMDDPEQGCIVQADDPHMLAAAFDGANTSSALSSNNTWYWTSMLKLMEQGAAPSSSSTHTNNSNNAAYNSGSHFTPGQNTGHTLVPAATSSPSSSSVHDQALDSMLVSTNAMNTNDPDSSVWSQDFLSGPICESKPSNVHHLACSDDGLHELLYPRTVLELLFSDQLKLEQLPSWPDILQQTVGGGTSGKNFGFPLAPDKIATAPTLHNIVNSENQLGIKIPPYLNNFSHLQAGLDDRLSSSTASSTLSDNTIDQWAPPNAGPHCEHAQAPHSATIMHASAPLNGMQQIDYTQVKQEYPQAPSPPYTNNDINNHYPIRLSSPYLHQNQRLIAHTAGNVMDEAILNNEFEQKPALINKHWTPSIIPNDPLNHRHHIYESITAANFSHNVRLGGLDAANCFQHVNNHMGGTGAATMEHSRAGPGTPASLHYINQPSQPIGKKSRPLEGAGTGQVDEARKENNRGASEIDRKAKGAVHSTPGTNVSSPNHNQQQQQQQLSGTEYNFKRSRIDQSSPAPTSSSSSLKNPPVRKEKLGERITTLQQLVSPFGKTDTASVLLEAIGYIKFLQDQVQALSSPYFKSPTAQSGDEVKPDLRSRGLCLVPLSCTMQVANDNGADYWYGGAFR